MTNLVLNDFASFFPTTWKASTAYESTLYVLVELNKGDADYNKIESLFDRQIAKIHRVQHPIAYLRYLVQSEFLENESISFDENLKYFPVSGNEVDVCLSYNCDPRVVSGSPSFSQHPHNLHSEYVIIVNSRTGYQITENDKNHYPLYAVSFSESK